MKMDDNIKQFTPELLSVVVDNIRNLQLNTEGKVPTVSDFSHQIQDSKGYHTMMAALFSMLAGGKDEPAAAVERAFQAGMFAGWCAREMADLDISMARADVGITTNDNK
jgi:hypothetical protein